jgi:hypothetical protein
MWYLNVALVIGLGSLLFPISLLVIIMVCRAKAFVSDSSVSYPIFFQNKFFQRFGENKSNNPPGEIVFMLFNPLCYFIIGMLWPFAIIGIIGYGILLFIRATNRLTKFSKKLAKVSHSHNKSVKTSPGVDSDDLELWKSKTKEPKS